MALFEEIEKRLLARGETPLSLLPQRAFIEAAMVDAWSWGTNPAMETLLKEKHESAVVSAA